MSELRTNGSSPSGLPDSGLPDSGLPAGGAIDRWSEIASIGAGHAATALSVLAGRSVWMAPPRVERTADPLRETWHCGALFSLDGPARGQLAVLLPDAKVVAEVLGLPADFHSAAGADREAALCSALAELGNILVSHAAGAMADALGGVSLPSPPQTVLGSADEAMRGALDERPYRGPLRVCSELFDETGMLRAMLVFVPDVPLA